MRRPARIVLSAIEVAAGGVLASILYGGIFSPPSLLQWGIAFACLVAFSISHDIATGLAPSTQGVSTTAATRRAVLGVVAIAATAVLVVVGVSAWDGAHLSPTAPVSAAGAPDLYLPKPNSSAQRAVEITPRCAALDASSSIRDLLRSADAVIVDGRCLDANQSAPVGAYTSAHQTGSASALLFTGAVIADACTVTSDAIRASQGDPDPTWIRFEDAGVSLFFPAIWTQGPLPARCLPT